nr:hypothetical protein [Tanacetum cinerariifolium]
MVDLKRSGCHQHASFSSLPDHSACQEDHVHLEMVDHPFPVLFVLGIMHFYNLVVKISAVIPRTTTNADGTSTSIIPGLVTTEEKAQKKNNVKAKSMLLMALSNEHLLTFSQYKDAKTLFKSIQARFGGNDATKKTQKTILKQMYENFNAPSIESLDSIFNRLQKIVSQLAILDLDTMRFDDLYNNFKIIEQEVKRIVTTSSSLGSQNMDFLSSPGSTNEIDTANIQASTISASVSTVNTHDNTANLSDATEMDLKWQLALLSMKARRYFQRTSKKITINGSDTAGSPKNQESMPRNQDNLIKTLIVKQWWQLMEQVLIGATWLMMRFQPTWLLWLSQTQSRIGLGFASYNAVAPPPTGLFAPSTVDLSNSGLEEFKQPEFEGYGPKASKILV